MCNSAMQGFTLIEVLISMLLLSILLLGFDTLGFFTLQATKESLYLNIATHQMHSIEERLRALDHYEGLNSQIISWNQENKLVLPNGKGEVTGKFPDYIISLHWDATTITDLKESIHL